MSENLGGCIWRRMRIVSAAILVVGTGCASREASKSDPAKVDSTKPRPSAPVSAASSPRVVHDVAIVPLHAPRNLVENSAAAMSARQPGVLFTINDSGNEALLFAIDTMGAGRGVWRVLNAANVDWEATSMGPCGGQASGRCVYIGDVGDNNATHPSRQIYRVAEPDAVPAGMKARVGAVQAEVLQFVYADRPHDVEALYVAPNGDMVLITKRPIFAIGTRLRPALVFRIPSSAWGTRGNIVAALADSLPIVPGSSPFRLITDASLSPDAKHLAVRTYAQAYIFATDSLTGAIDHAVTPSVCDITALNEYQGEGVTWANNTGRLVFTSEGRRAPLNLGDCALP